MKQLKYKQEARKWADKAEDEDEAARVARKQMRVEAEEYLSLIEQALQGTKKVEELFSIYWNIIP